MIIILRSRSNSGYARQKRYYVRFVTHLMFAPEYKSNRMQASIYRHEGNYEQSYMLLMRYIDLVIERLRGHPEGKLPAYKAPLRHALNLLPTLVEEMEAMKPTILRKQEAYEARLKEERSAAASFGADGEAGRRLRPFHLSEADAAVAGRTRTIPANDHGDIPVKLYKRESRRRDDAKDARRSDRDREVRGNSESGRRDDDVDMRWAMEDTRRRLNKSQDIPPQRPRKLSKSRSPARSFSSRPPPTDYAYPSIRKSQPLGYDERPRSRDQPYKPSSNLAPPLPAKEALINPMSHDTRMRPPSRPDKILRDEPPAPRPSTSPPNDTEEYTFQPSAYLENGNPLRCLFLPADLRTTFLSIASKNTRNNLETCGMLCGTIMSNALFISRLVIPEQEGTSDMCEMTNENALFEYCTQEDLIVLGWIHTHPSQSCFMSSRDLHTHCGFQVMMPEAVAIVCAPSRDKESVSLACHAC